MIRAKVLRVGDNTVEGVLNNKAKGEKMGQEAPTNSALRRKLGDITNLQHQRKLVNQGAKQQQQQAILQSATEHVEKLQKENVRLVKVLAERNEIIERKGTEMQKLRINLQKVKEQNLLLAQTNTRLLAESNTSKDQLKALQHELSCKNGLLMARKLLPESQNLPCTRRHASEDKDHANTPGEACESFHPNGMDHNTGKRKQQSTSESSNVNSLQTNEKDYNKRRVSGRRNPANPEVFDIASREGESIETTNIRRVSLRRQSGRFNILELGVTESLNGTHGDKEIAANAGCSANDQSIESKLEAVEPHDTNEIIAKRRVSSRRQSSNQRAIKESADAPLHHDIIEESSQISPSVSMALKRESENKPRGDEAEETRNTTVGRPQRQAAVKIKTYKEVSLKEKMRQ